MKRFLGQRPNRLNRLSRGIIAAQTQLKFLKKPAYQSRDSSTARQAQAKVEARKKVKGGKGSYPVL